MRFERVRARAFGRFEEFDSGSESLSDLTVVVGPNESGKTTFFHVLSTLMYGIYPTARDQHPYAPWSGRDLHVEGDILLDTGQPWRVQRRLLTSPSGHLSRGDREESLRNQTLECASHVPREVFHQVFALTMAEVSSLESETWAEIQDRLIGAMGARDLVSARVAAHELETEAGALWRPHRRGKQAIRELRDRRRDALARRRDAVESDRALRMSVRDLAQTVDEVAGLKRLRERLRLVADRTTTLLPIRKQLDRAAELESEAGPPAALDSLPRDPAGAHETLTHRVTELQRRLEEIAEEAADAQERIRAFGAEHRRLVEARRDVEAVAASVAALESTIARQGGLEQETRDRRRRIDSVGNDLFERPLTEDERLTVRRLVRRDLQDRVSDAVRARERRRDREARSDFSDAIPAPPRHTLLVALSAGLGAAALFLFAGDSARTRAAVFVLALLSAVVLAGLWMLREARRRIGYQGSEATPGGPAGDGLDALFTGLPVRPELLPTAGPELVVTITRLQDLMEELDARVHEAEGARQSVSGVERDLAELGGRLDVELPHSSAAAVHVLEARLREAERFGEDSKAAEREIERLTPSETAAQGELDTCTEELRALEQALREFGDGDVAEGLRIVEERRRAAERAREIREDLERSHPDLDELLARLDEGGQADDGPLDDEALAETRTELDTLSDRIEALVGRQKELEGHKARAEEQATTDQVDGEIAALEEEMSELQWEHDRKLVLAHVIREADHRFREEHQPDVVRRASAYFETVTDGRYDRITVGEAGDFRVRGPDQTAAVEAGDLSTGARQQLYLSIRLAIMGHLDQGRERLPVFIDEAFVNWDAARRNRGFEVLKELSRDRQVFVMTCHTDWADELVGHGAHRLDLEAR